MRNRAFSGESFHLPETQNPEELQKKNLEIELIEIELIEIDHQPPEEFPDVEEDNRFDSFTQSFYKLPAAVLKAEAFSFLKESLSLILSQAANLFIIL